MQENSKATIFTRRKFFSIFAMIANYLIVLIQFADPQLLRRKNF